MFIEKLTKEQIRDFFRMEGYAIENKDVSCFVNSNMFDKEDKYLYVCIDSDKYDMSINYRMYDFEGSTISRESKWRNYLYTIFGGEYKEAYQEYLQKQMNEKIFGLEKLPELEEKDVELEER